MITTGFDESLKGMQYKMALNDLASLWACHPAPPINFVCWTRCPLNEQAILWDCPRGVRSVIS